ncbi:MAG TPA: P1 family peptidase [Gemmatimonadales bacterium]|nr:P1 family peptidase [Gemmatimonadales bacterium]
MRFGSALVFLVLGALHSGEAVAQQRTRARALGITPGVLQPGVNNAITDVAGVRVGHATIIEGDSVRTGVTAILPHDGNLYFDRVPAAIHVGNGFGKLLGATQVAELGELETPILLTCTLCVWKAADAMVAHLLEAPGMAGVRSINPVVGETNDGWVLNAIRQRPVSPRDVRAALTRATAGAVPEGSVGAGTGTVAFGWKGGIGTSSRRTAPGDTGWTVGVLVQSNFGGDLQILGVPVGRALGRGGVRTAADRQGARGSIMIVVATDAPLSHRNLRRLAARAIIGLGRTGSSADNGSGDYVIAFSTHPAVRRRAGQTRYTVTELANDVMSPLFQATVEATEEAIYNSLFAATTIASRSGRVEALPVNEVLGILRAHRALR